MKLSEEKNKLDWQNHKMETVQRKQPINPCETSNCLSKIFFTWTLPFFKKGYQKTLQLDDIFEPLISDRSNSLGDRLEEWVLNIFLQRKSYFRKYCQFKNWIRTNLDEWIKIINNMHYNLVFGMIQVVSVQVIIQKTMNSIITYGLKFVWWKKMSRFLITVRDN